MLPAGAMRTRFLLGMLGATLLLSGPANAKEPGDGPLSGVFVASLPLSPEAPEAMRGASGTVVVQPHPDAVVMARRSTALMVAGIAMAAVGTGVMIGGATMVADGNERDAHCERRDAPQGGIFIGCSLAGFAQAVGYGVIAGGGSFVLAGIPMAIVGAWKVPVEPKKTATVIPAIAVAPRAASMTWRF